MLSVFFAWGWTEARLHHSWEWGTFLPVQCSTMLTPWQDLKWNVWKHICGSMKSKTKCKIIPWKHHLLLTRSQQVLQWPCTGWSGTQRNRKSMSCFSKVTAGCCTETILLLKGHRVQGWCLRDKPNPSCCFGKQCQIQLKIYIDKKYTALSVRVLFFLILLWYSPISKLTESSFGILMFPVV